MAKYFNIQTGLRGCYMPNESYVVMVATRRELKDVIETEAARYRDANAAGLSKKAVAAFAATMWKEAQKEKPAYLPHCLPIKPEGAQSYSEGIFASVASRSEYLDYQKTIDA